MLIQKVLVSVQSYYIKMKEITQLRKITDKSDETKQKKRCQKIAIEVFVCSCQKQYSSFPALYLHSKKKHGIYLSISEKKDMVRKTVWSGVNKKYVYEFREDFEEESSVNKSFCGRKISGISEILDEYMDETNSKDKNSCYQKIGKIITNQLQLCLQHCGGKIYKMEEQGFISKIQAIPANLPHMFNYFVVKYQPGRAASSVSQENTLKFLSELSSWIHAKGYSPFIAEINV